MTHRIRLDTGLLDLDRRVLITARGPVEITKLENALLTTLVQAGGRPVDRATLLREVWGYRANVRTRSIDHVVKRLRAKIERDRGRPRHLLTVKRVGYRLEVHATERTTSTGLIGRESEKRILASRLREPGLCVLLGPAGVGKTALARHLAADPRAWVPLSGVDNLEQGLAAVGVALGVTARGRDAATRIGQRLALGAELLVLDGVEQMAQPLTGALQQWMELAPSARVLVTSRVRLHAPHAQLFELAPLRPPAAAELFLHRLARCGTISPSTKQPGPRWTSSWRGWTVCHWPSSSRRRGPRCWPRSSCSTTSTSASPGSRVPSGPGPHCWTPPGAWRRPTSARPSRSWPCSGEAFSSSRPGPCWTSPWGSR